MGISRGAVKLISLMLDGGRLAQGKAITYGVQVVQATAGEVAALLPTSALPKHARGAIHQDELFGSLGYDSTESIDYYPDESPTHVLDLNHPLPATLHGRYDLVYDGGTMEHCFDTAVFLQNTVDLLAPGGVVMHHVPMNNWIDHGFYQFSPTLFFDYYGGNGFTDLEMVLHLMAKGGKESFLPYDPRKDGRLPYSFGSTKRALILFKARKPVSTTTASLQYPIQGRYRQTFGKEEGDSASPGKRTLSARLKRSLHKRLFQFAFKPL